MTKRQEELMAAFREMLKDLPERVMEKLEAELGDEGERVSEADRKA